MAEFGVLPADDVEIEGAKGRHHGAHAAGADGAVIDAGDGGDLDARAAEEGLVGEGELGAVDRAFDDGNAELFAQQL